MSYICNGMGLIITSLNSGSNGNCYYVGNEQEAVLIDAGISCREIERRMKRLGLALQNVKAIFVSHEHSDHIRGISVLSKKHQIPVYITSHTYQYGKLGVQAHLLNAFTGYEPVQIGGLSVSAFPKFHDASDPHSFIVSCEGVNVGVFTDIGAPCEHVLKHFSLCHAAFLEANYDEEMLDKGHYPYHLKNRIKGGHGHLSNRQALDIFNTYKSPELSYLVLSHISKENNCPDLVKELFENHAQGVEIVVASRYQEMPVYNMSTGAPEAEIKIPSQKMLTFDF